MGSGPVRPPRKYAPAMLHKKEELEWLKASYQEYPSPIKKKPIVLYL